MMRFMYEGRLISSVEMWEIAETKHKARRRVLGVCKHVWRDGKCTRCDEIYDLGTPPPGDAETDK